MHARWTTVAAVAIAIVATMAPPASERLQLACATTVIVLLGVPHGAADILLWRHSGARSIARFVAMYVATAGLLVALWVVAPIPFVAAFLALSAWHFGDGDVAAVPTGRLPVPIEVAARGALPIAIPLVAHPTAAAEALAPLLMLPSADAAAAWTQAFAWMMAAPIALAAAVLPWTTRRGDGAPWTVLGEVAAIAALGVALPPLLSFALVFTAFHGLRHMLRIDGATGMLRRSGAGGAIALVTLIAVIVGTGSWILVPSAPLPSPSLDWIRPLFVGLAALTVPHAWTVVRALGTAGRGACRRPQGPRRSEP